MKVKLKVSELINRLQDCGPDAREFEVEILVNGEWGWGARRMDPMMDLTADVVAVEQMGKVYLIAE